MIVEGKNLKPSIGYKYVSDGETWSDWVILGKNDTADNWHDTNDEPPVPPAPVEVSAEEIKAELEAIL